MGRKNTSAKRRNTMRDRRAHGERRATTKVHVPRIDVGDLVIPDGYCKVGRKPKARYGTEAKAREALSQAQRVRARAGSGHVEKRFYFCDHCEGWHLSSREEYHGPRS